MCSSAVKVTLEVYKRQLIAVGIPLLLLPIPLCIGTKVGFVSI
jgi:hypothetical protein